LLKETKGVFDGAWTNDLHITSQTGNPMRQAVPITLSSIAKQTRH